MERSFSMFSRSRWAALLGGALLLFLLAWAVQGVGAQAPAPATPLPGAAAGSAQAPGVPNVCLGANPVTNPNFETGSLTGWTRAGNNFPTLSSTGHTGCCSA